MWSKEKEASSTIGLDNRQAHQSATYSPRSPDQWRPGFWAQFPWIGVCSLAGALLMSIVSVIVLCVSDGKAVSQWSDRIAPNVILTILNSFASVCFAVAVGRGIAVSWWRKALRGTTIQDLSRSWSFGYDTLTFLSQARYFNLIALAALATKLSIVDGTLYQRATTTYVALGPKVEHNMTTFPTDDFPTTAYVGADPNIPRFLETSFTFDVSTWIRSGGDKVDGTYGFNDCQGVCFVKYPGPGFAMSCSSHTQGVDLVAGNFGGTGVNNTGSSTTINLFDISFNYTYATPSKNYNWIGLNMTNYNTQDQTNGTSCPAELVQQQCELRPAILNYPVVAESTNVVTKLQRGNDSQGSVVTVYLGELNDTDGSWEGIGQFDPNLGQVSGFDILSYINLTNHSSSFGPSSIGGIMLAMQEFYSGEASVTVFNNDTAAWYESSQGLIGSLSWLPTNNTNCPTPTVDPLSTIMTYLNKLTFIMADDLYNRPAYTQMKTQAQINSYWDSVVQSTAGIQYKAEVHYKTDYGFMFGALASTIICILLVIPAYWGFWELGRPVSFDPIEVGHAFGAPSLADARIGSGHVREVVVVAGEETVRYDEDNSQGRMFQRVHD